MLSCRLFRIIRDKGVRVPVNRCFHPDFSQPDTSKTIKSDVEAHEKVQSKSTTTIGSQNLTGALSQKYKIFREEESPEILDIFEERERYQLQDESEELVDDTFTGINLNRGVTGVFDIEDLVSVLRKEYAEDIFVCTVPKEIKYVDYIVICSGRSYRHMLAMADFVRRVFKMKREKQDILPRIEGEKSHDWMAIDLGNIALHIFSPTIRETYDLESLWAIGVEYDWESHKPADPLVELFEKHSALLADLKPGK